LGTQAGFSNTHNLLAFSDTKSANLNSFRVNAGKASQERYIQIAEQQGEECMPALIVSAPTFSHDDLALLPPTSAIRRGWESAEDSMHLPYFMGPSAENLKKLVERRFSHCNTDVLFKRANEFSKEFGASRIQWVQDLDSLVKTNLNKLPRSRIVLISSVPDIGAHYRRKRQISDEAWSMMENEGVQVDETYDSGADTDFSLDGGARPTSVFAEGYTPAQASDNSTVDPSAGLLFRYSFTSPALVFASLIVLLVLIPAILFSINALTSIELVKGLEGKMQGGAAGAEGKKDQ